MAFSNKTAASCSELAAVALFASLWSSSTAASNGTKSVVPASFLGTECLTTISRAVDPSHVVAIGLPYEDVGTTPDEPPGSRRMQFFATCRDRVAGEVLPPWISRSDADAAAAVDPTVLPPTAEEILEEAAAWNGPGHDGDGSPCVVPINAADERLEISCEATADGVTWNTAGAPAGAYVVWGYTYEGARSLWSRRPGVVRIVDDDPDAAPPAVAFASPSALGEMGLESGLMIEGCAAGAPGTVLTLSWATNEDLADDPVASWITFAELDADAFAVPFLPPPEALYSGIVFRAEVRDPLGRSFALIASDYVTVVPGCDAPSGGRAGVVDACGVGIANEAPPPVSVEDCSDVDAATESGEGGDAEIETDGSGDPDPSADATHGEDGCACRVGERDADLAWFALSMIAWRRRRR